jgi:hypothetical protein
VVQLHWHTSELMKKNKETTPYLKAEHVLHYIRKSLQFCIYFKNKQIQIKAEARSTGMGQYAKLTRRIGIMGLYWVLWAFHSPPDRLPQPPGIRPKSTNGIPDFQSGSSPMRVEPQRRRRRDSGEDRISGLPDALLHEILVRLRSPTPPRAPACSPAAGATSGRTCPTARAPPRRATRGRARVVPAHRLL